MINILIRTSYRPVAFKRLLDSIHNQTFKNIRIIVSYDDDRALDYIPSNIDKIRVQKSNEIFYYDSYCNNLMDLVTDGYFMFIDDDDHLPDSGALMKVSKHLNRKQAIICQMIRNGKPKPSNDMIRNKVIMKGKIGMPCIIIHSDHKNIARFDGSVGAADFLFIKNIQKKIPVKFINVAVAYCSTRSYGAME